MIVVFIPRFIFLFVGAKHLTRIRRPSKQAFLASYDRAKGELQVRVSYGPAGPGEEMPNVCSNQIAQRFDCFLAPLEKPFKGLWCDATRGDGGDLGAGDNVGWGRGRARRPASRLATQPGISPRPASS